MSFNLHQRSLFPKRTSLFKLLCQVSCFKSAITNIIGHLYFFIALFFSRKRTSILLYLFNEDSIKVENSRSDYEISSFRVYNFLFGFTITFLMIHV